MSLSQSQSSEIGGFILDYGLSSWDAGYLALDTRRRTNDILEGMMIAPNTFVTHNIEFLWMKEEEDETQGGTIVRQYRFRKDGKQASALIYGTEQLRSMPNYDDYAMDKAVDIIKRLE